MLSLYLTTKLNKGDYLTFKTKTNNKNIELGTIQQPNTDFLNPLGLVEILKESVPLTATLSINSI